MNIHNLTSRRKFVSQAFGGVGAAALGTLLQGDANADVQSQVSGKANKFGLPHFQPTAKRVIYLFMSGGPSHIDLFDYKPLLEQKHGEELPPSVRGNQRLTGMTAKQKGFPVCGPIGQFAQHGECGAWISDLLPHTSKIVDDIAIIRSMNTEAINHDPGITFINTGSQIPGQPSAGAWASYGLGSENQNMPAYVVLLSQGTGKNPGQPIFSRLWGSGFLPSNHQGVMLRSSGDPVLYLKDPDGITRENRRDQLDHLAALNRLKFQTSGDPEIETRISQYEMAFRMQAAAPEIADLSDEPESTFQLYGEDARQPGTYAFNCLMARRMAERDVRFVQLFHRGWDQHVSLQTHLRAQCLDTDQASAALITDLKNRGMLNDTLVIWGGEFGRTAYGQGKLGSGRDHHGRCFSMWMAGGGVRGGVSYGQTDEFAYNIAENGVHIRDLNATMLHCLGIDHERFTYRFQGLDQRLTGVEHAHVVSDILLDRSTPHV
ncbi:MAG TPA: sulfatase [Planctomycetaceae bacterium]|nr:sulfatase [Planctomycetaceae bacterium]